MPVDFDSLPKYQEVRVPKHSMVLWLLAFVIVEGAGVLLGLMLWPADLPAQTPWFWIRILGAPLLLYIVIFFANRFLAFHRLLNTLADNTAIDAKRDTMHKEASIPLAVIDSAWRFSSTDAENTLSVALKPSGSPDEKSLRALSRPDRQYYPGNRQDEKERHAALFEWLLIDLLTPLMPALQHASRVGVSLFIGSLLPPKVVEDILAKALGTLKMRPSFSIEVCTEGSLLPVDKWLDQRESGHMRLAIAAQLCGAISGDMRIDQSEAGAALLFCPISPNQQQEAHLAHVHRPATGGADDAEALFTNALRWGNCRDDKVETVWLGGLAKPLEEAFRGLENPAVPANEIALSNTIGDAGVAAPWLALALSCAAANESGKAQLILDERDGDLVALICRKQV
ncbi:hypothetical protein [Pandoraea communis]|uniref:hypothetical protein n=1 Tax=Pandoraea communis TaxID=2508297 RepID=UPI0025A50597|nr:hypothetical protein [Pandoraea communis]MDM8359319.1 hypothetical protein [Pandoraea communis]